MDILIDSPYYEFIKEYEASLVSVYLLEYLGNWLPIHIPPEEMFTGLELSLGNTSVPRKVHFVK